MKVLFITRKYPPSVGGMESFAYNLSNEISKKAYIELLKWGGSNKYLPLVIPYLFLLGAYHLIINTIDIIHMQDGVVAPVGYILSRIFKKPYVVVIHGKDASYKGWLFTKINIPAIRAADKVICISHAAASEAKNRGVEESKIQILPIAVEDNLRKKPNKVRLMKHYGILQNDLLIITVGRLVKRKGVNWFVQNVMPGLVKQNDRIKYLVIGEGFELGAIQASIEKLKLQNHVILAGKVTDDLLRDLYNSSDIFVMPNINVPNDVEGFGLVLLEASLCELPVVASNTEGIKDAVMNDKNGILVNVKDSHGFIREINTFLADKKLRLKFGQRSRSFTKEHYNWRSIAKSYIQIYKQLASNK